MPQRLALISSSINKKMDFTNINEIAKFLNGVNHAVYGVRPFAELERLGGEETESSVDAVVGVGSEKEVDAEKIKDESQLETND